jgi:hypothetical protein
MYDHPKVGPLQIHNAALLQELRILNKNRGIFMAFNGNASHCETIRSKSESRPGRYENQQNEAHSAARVRGESALVIFRLRL